VTSQDISVYTKSQMHVVKLNLFPLIIHQNRFRRETPLGSLQCSPHT